MKYPYIGRGKVIDENKRSGVEVLFYARDAGVVVGGCDYDEVGEFYDIWNESHFENITREYLTNTYGEVESQEHAEFIIRLAESCGFAGYSLDRPFKPIKYFSIAVGSLIFLSTKDVAARHGGIKITLPLPPKEDDMKGEGVNNEEWLIGGCDCIYEGELYHFLCKSPFSNAAVITRASSKDWDVISASYDDLERSPTPVEALAELIDESLYATVDMDDILKIAKVIINGDIEGVKYEK